jgi:hypothetical protein
LGIKPTTENRRYNKKSFTVALRDARLLHFS